MPRFITKTELETQKSDNKTTHNVGELYPQIFSTDSDKLEFNADMKLEAGIIQLGKYMLDNGLFPKEKCPVCGKEEALIPYKAIGSMLSGGHTIQFYCTSCGEKLVTNDYIEYFRLIYKDVYKKQPTTNYPGQFVGNVI